MSSRIGMVLTLISAIPLQAAQVPELPTRQRGATGLGEQLVERARRGQIAHRLHHARAQDVLHLQLVEVGKGLGQALLLARVVVAPALAVAVGLKLLARPQDLGPRAIHGAWWECRSPGPRTRSCRTVPGRGPPVPNHATGTRSGTAPPVLQSDPGAARPLRTCGRCAAHGGGRSRGLPGRACAGADSRTAA